MVIFPDYRGPSAGNVPVTKTVETEWEQADWNIDRCDGTGKTGYTIDPTKMQMFYMDYSWYGAGFVRWGFRALNGDIIYAHKIPNNNQNTEAYMRSGNLPARYEVNTIPPSKQLQLERLQVVILLCMLLMIFLSSQHLVHFALSNPLVLLVVHKNILTTLEKHHLSKTLLV